MSELNLVTNRTAEDVERLKIARRDILLNGVTSSFYDEWLNGMKGAYNASDINRVLNALTLLRAKALDKFVAIPEIPMEEATVLTIPSQEYIMAYLQNIRNVYNSISIPSEIPAVPQDLDQFTYEQANAIETIIEYVWDALDRLSWFYVGEAMSATAPSGDNICIQLGESIPE